MGDDDIYSLSDLIHSDFDMSASDKDYKLSPDQLIKVCKILLHKINFYHRKGGHDRELGVL